MLRTLLLLLQYPPCNIFFSIIFETHTPFTLSKFRTCMVVKFLLHFFFLRICGYKNTFVVHGLETLKVYIHSVPYFYIEVTYKYKKLKEEMKANQHLSVLWWMKMKSWSSKPAGFPRTKDNQGWPWPRVHDLCQKKEIVLASVLKTGTSKKDFQEKI